MLYRKRPFLTSAALLMLGSSFASAQVTSVIPSTFVNSNTSVDEIAAIFYADTAAIPLSKAITVRGMIPQQQDNRCVMQEGNVRTQSSSTKRFELQAGQASHSAASSINQSATATSTSIQPLANAASTSNTSVPPNVVPVVERPVSSLSLSLNYALDSDKLSDQDKLLLKKVADAMNEIQLKRVSFAVIGHTDSSGTRAYNLELSCSRAYIVSQYLMALGVDASRITAYGFGPDQLLEKSAGVSAKNRRVEIRRAN